MNSVPFTKAERLIIPRQRIKLRRALEGASTFRCSAMAESNRAVFESMRPGDYVLITAQGATELDYLARVVTKFESEELGRELWSGGKRDLLSLIYAIEDVRKLSVDKAKLKKALGYDPKDSLVGVKRVDQKSLETQSARFGSVEGLLSNL